jgi:hypothetical protein
VLTASRRLPGIEVGVTPRPAAEALPRMDVAVLVGFASTGPVHTAVAVESVAQFADVFGPDAPLAWDDLHGERVFAYLGPAVRAFFANGGRRCWIVRVANRPIANECAMPGVLSIARDGTVSAAIAAARCEGSWSDPLRVASALQKRSFAIDGLGTVASPSSPSGASAGFFTRFGLRTGDLVELDDANGLCVYATVDAVRATPDAGGPYTVEATVCAAFERLRDAGFPASPSTAIGTAEILGVADPVPATLDPPPDPADPAGLTFDAPIPASLEAGGWVRWSDGGAPGSNIWLRIDTIARVPMFAGSPTATDSPLMTATVTGPAWREVDPLAFSWTSVRHAHLVSIDVRVDAAGEQVAHVNGVGLTPGHRDAWWNQLTDADFFRQDDDGRERATEASRQDRPRFPLARAVQLLPRAWVPLGVTALFGPSLAPLPQSLTALERDGLARFDADLFLDPELAGVPLNHVEELADAIRFVRDRTRPLRGLHAAWSLGAGGLFNEGSLLAIPDAIHLGWHKRTDDEIPRAEPLPPPAPAQWHTHRGPCAKPADGSMDGPDFGVFLDCATRDLTAPILEGPAAPVPPGVYRLTWTDSEPSGSYVLTESTQADLSDAREFDAGQETEHVALNQREGVYYYQVFARVRDERSEGSNVVAVRVRSDEWVQNHPTDAVTEALEREWLAVHRGALRMAAASGDLFAVLAMPRHFRSEQALRYAQRLREVRQPPGLADVDAFGFTEASALSYGALYFPWLQSNVRATNASGENPGPPPTRSPRVVPPDGVALGVLAARASSRGAWIAPANEPLRDVVALTPPVPSGDWQALLDAQINLVRLDSRGFLALSADTLACEIELRPINVRRLLTLLRRLALRRGSSYVFEPNGPVLRRSVERGFETILTELFRRGAFAGAAVEDSFRVVTDDTINRPADADAGRFLVELRVAPSLPMRFIGVQLAQSGERLTVTEEL